MAIQQVLPDADTLLGMELEELAEAVMTAARQDIASSNGRFSVSTLFTVPNHQTSDPVKWSSYKINAAERAVGEAIYWLLRELLIMPADLDNPGNMFVFTRRGAQIKGRTEFDVHLREAVLPRGVVHQSIEPLMRTLFMKGHYEEAVPLAFKEVEIAVRDAASYEAELHGVPLMRKAFNPESGRLANKSLLPAERSAEADLFAGAMGHARNPGLHRRTTTSASEASQLVQLASYLLGLVDQRKKLLGGGNA